MVVRLFIVLALFVGIFNQISCADDIRNLDDLIQSDREERILKINQLTSELNLSLDKLNTFHTELKRAEDKDHLNGGSRIALRNAASVAAAVGLISTILFQSKGINPSKIILGGGYSLSALAAVISVLEQRAIHFTKEEIIKLTASVTDLEKLVKIEKRNLASEIRLLCLGDGGSLDECTR
ncbi:MAG: hypothetical protein H7281_05230 [Bacteriovorax sp.]|nr:hypothetical protein [Bacteriovorax sp.]